MSEMAIELKEEDRGGPGVAKERKPYTLTKRRENWSNEEHAKFTQALLLFSRDWKKIEAYVGTKSVVQIRSHAQKFFQKVIKQGGSGAAIPPPRSKRPKATDENDPEPVSVVKLQRLSQASSQRPADIPSAGCGNRSTGTVVDMLDNSTDGTTLDMASLVQQSNYGLDNSTLSFSEPFNIVAARTWQPLPSEFADMHGVQLPVQGHQQHCFSLPAPSMTLPMPVPSMSPSSTWMLPPQQQATQQQQMLLPPAMQLLGPPAAAVQQACPHPQSALRQHHSGMSQHQQLPQLQQHSLGGGGRSSTRCSQDSSQCGAPSKGRLMDQPHSHTSRDPNLYIVYSYLGSLFDPQFDQADHAEALKDMVAADREAAVIMLGSVTKQLAGGCMLTPARSGDSQTLPNHSLCQQQKLQQTQVQLLQRTGSQHTQNHCSGSMPQQVELDRGEHSSAGASNQGCGLDAVLGSCGIPQPKDSNAECGSGSHAKESCGGTKCKTKGQDGTPFSSGRGCGSSGSGTSAHTADDSRCGDATCNGAGCVQEEAAAGTSGRAGGGDTTGGTAYSSRHSTQQQHSGRPPGSPEENSSCQQQQQGHHTGSGDQSWLDCGGGGSGITGSASWDEGRVLEPQEAAAARDLATALPSSAALRLPQGLTRFGPPMGLDCKDARMDCNAAAWPSTSPAAGVCPDSLRATFEERAAGRLHWLRQLSASGFKTRRHTAANYWGADPPELGSGNASGEEEVDLNALLGKSSLDDEVGVCRALHGQQ